MEINKELVDLDGLNGANDAEYTDENGNSWYDLGDDGICEAAVIYDPQANQKLRLFNDDGDLKWDVACVDDADPKSGRPDGLEDRVITDSDEDGLFTANDATTTYHTQKPAYHPSGGLDPMPLQTYLNQTSGFNYDRILELQGKQETPVGLTPNEQQELQIRISGNNDGIATTLRDDHPDRDNDGIENQRDFQPSDPYRY